MKKLTILLLLITITQLAMAQQPCGTSEYESYLESKFPGYSRALDQTRQESSYSSERLNKADNDTVYRIPVVFHIVWNNSQQNIHDSLILSQLKALNEAFRHTHSDTGKVRSIFKPVAGDTKIEFYLATHDPSGQPTNGIDRVYSPKSDFGEANLFAEGVKSSSNNGADAWNTEKYLNIWVCKFTYNGSLAITAYAFPPTNAQFWSSSSYTSSNLQGVVINYQYVGKSSPHSQDASSLKERTLVHEVGHYLGLRHIWGDKNNTCSGQDDGVKDTPVSRAANRFCNANTNTCNEGTGDKPDMTENYMDYAAYPCTKMFTHGQSNLMRFNLLNLRPKLYEMQTTAPPPVTPIYSKISVAPNPLKDNLNIIFDQKGDYEMTISDIIGQQVVSEKFTVGDEYKYNRALSISPGFYHLIITGSNNTVLKQRILVQ